MGDMLAARNAIASGGRSKQAGGSRGYATPIDGTVQKEYAFEVSVFRVYCTMSESLLIQVRLPQVSAANLRFGEGVTRVRDTSHKSYCASTDSFATFLGSWNGFQESGDSFVRREIRCNVLKRSLRLQKATKVGVWTDATVAKLLPMQMAIESLEAAGVPYEVWDKTRVEPNQTSYVFQPVKPRTRG